MKKMSVTSCSAQKRSHKKEERITAVMCTAQAAQMNKTVEVEEPTKCSARGAHGTYTLPPQAVQVLCKKSVHKPLTLGRDKMLVVYMLDLTKSLAREKWG